MTGQTISHYKITAKLGEGGMGEVYKAEDTKLQRTVALKFLLPHLVSDAAGRERFLREAQAAAALNHSNICHVYEIDDSGPRMFIAMEFVEGPSVAQKINSGDAPARPLPLAEALDIAIQTAAGLHEAHEKAIIHRDIKGANVLLTAKGQAKITDFGLAQLSERSRLTKSGITLGTPAYMSPEQAQNLPSDHRTDIWSLGVMLYEMLTARLPFDGDYEQAIVYSIINEDPAPVTSLRAGLPMDLEWILGKVLAKAPAERYQHADDLMVDLERVRRYVASGALTSRAMVAAPGAKPGSGTSAVPRDAGATIPVSRAATLRKTGLVAAAVVAVAVLAFFAAREFNNVPAPGTGPTIKFTIFPKELGKGAAGNIDSEVSISHDGKHIAYVESEGGQLWIRDLDQENARLVPGATHVYQTFWSPDDKFIGYAVGGGLVKIPIEGGTATPICKLNGLFKRASFSPDGETIVFCDETGLYTVPAKGGPPARVNEHPHIEHPSILELPGGGQAYLFQAVDTPPNHGIYVLRVGDDHRELVVTSSSTNPYPVYSETGHIIYVDGNGQSTAIWALPFSLATLKPAGTAFPVAQHAASPALSREGTLVYGDVPVEELKLAWCDRSGKTLSTIGEPEVLNRPVLSPDGRYLASEIRIDKGINIRLFDLERQTATWFTTGPFADCCVAWPPSGDEITYVSNRNGNFDIFSRAPNSSGEAKVLVATPLPETSPAWSPDGRFLMYQVSSPETKMDLLYRERKGDGSLGEPIDFLRTPFAEFGPAFSPDGHFVAYMSAESGRNEVYVRSFPDGGRKWQISTNTGLAPRWRRDGGEIFYVQTTKLMSVRVSNRNGFSVGPPELLLENQGLFGGAYGVAADGKRFVVRERMSQQGPLAIHIVHNWFAEFRENHRQ